ncbi:MULTISPECIES: TetR/AcrR family transcriptional regulator [Kocuria]|uniref:Transcriptional regulator, TetR family n=1 Tax=Kocuria marina subsp. indica TaxID=1049583 RepID=A0A1X7CN12_9MICC|nr:MULTISPECIES: TetR/AcrR family transcriptional regulator [Kocuria]OXS84359.1 hypothetical protein B1B07_04235 [Kocuria indica]RLP58551.1 TetR/AcrR family transcriptional regulator [Kocuria indica]SME99706.1 transcriptional regulator, TetR family [Kocuria indica]
MSTTRGRPRRNPISPTRLGARQDILHAAGGLFVERGFGQTSTRAIAEAAGLQQASVYHWFASKDEILLSLVLGTVEPSRTVADHLAALDEPGAVLLWALAFADTTLLQSDRQNLGVLYFEPELGSERFRGFHDNRNALLEAYAAMLERATGRPTADVDVTMTIGLVESVIMHRRRTRLDLPPETPTRIADAVLVLAGIPELLSEETRRGGRALVDPLLAAGADRPGRDGDDRERA